jgi:large subunit ribosomal protein L23
MIGNIHEILRAPLITEKGTILRETENLYLFRVAKTANKIQIRKAVETIFKVKVESVRTVRVRGKVKRVGRRIGRRPDWKKAYVKLKAGEKPIEEFEGI